jgi:predicted GNAT superfamily acetyltransferase
MNITIAVHHESVSSLLMWFQCSYRDGMTSPTSQLDQIAITIDRRGFEALDRATIGDVLALAEAADASPVLREVFADEHEPAPVRERAFGLLAMQISSGRRRSEFTLAA